VPTSHITPEMLSAVGREISWRVSFPITASDIRRWAVAVYYPDDPPAAFWRASHARGAANDEIQVPEEFNPFAWGSAEQSPSREAADGSVEATLHIDPPNLEFVLNGGMECDYGLRMRVGDVMRSVIRLHSYRERRGRLGLMLFTTTEDTWTNQDGYVVKTVRQTHIRY